MLRVVSRYANRFSKATVAFNQISRTLKPSSYSYHSIKSDQFLYLNPLCKTDSLKSEGDKKGNEPKKKDDLFGLNTKKLLKNFSDFEKNKYQIFFLAFSFLFLFYLYILSAAERDNYKPSNDAISKINSGAVSEAWIYRKFNNALKSYYELVILDENSKVKYEINDLHDIIALLNSKGIPFRLQDKLTPFSFVSFFYIKIFDNFLGIGMLVYILVLFKTLGSLQKLLRGSASVKFNVDSVSTRFSDVAGVEEAKTEMKEYVEFLKNRKKFADIGAKLPRGALLVGPPGTGKTLLAKACAGEAQVPFFATSGSELVEMYVGMGSRKIKNLFKDAKDQSPAIIFIDEIDAIGKKRGSSASDEKNRTLNQLLIELDGFDSKAGIIVFAATNFPESLDDALTRSGRFDRKIDFTLPSKAEREAILRVHLKEILVEPAKFDKTVSSVASLTPGFSGADLANLCNEAAIIAARTQKPFVTDDDFDRANERVVAGIETIEKLSQKLKNRISVHEAGKALASWFLESVGPVIKVSIRPRSKKQSGFSQYFKKDPHLQTYEELVEYIAFLISGKAAEEKVFGEASTNATDDLNKAYFTARKMITELGMSKELGLTSHDAPSETTSHEIEREVFSLMKKAWDLSNTIINERFELLKSFSKKLEMNEKLTHSEIVEIFGERAFIPSEDYKKYIEEEEMRYNASIEEKK